VTRQGSLNYTELSCQDTCLILPLLCHPPSVVIHTWSDRMQIVTATSSTKNYPCDFEIDLGRMLANKDTKRNSRTELQSHIRANESSCAIGSINICYARSDDRWMAAHSTNQHRLELIICQSSLSTSYILLFLIVLQCRDNRYLTDDHSH
jgi:hypothetical protein